jgi:hypothetical protein
MPQRSHHRRHRPVPMATRVKRSVTSGIRSVTNSPWLKFTTGVVLLTSGLDEAMETLFADLSALEMGAHHGVMVLGFVNVLSSLPDMLDGLTGTFLGDEEEAAAPVKSVPLEPTAHDQADPTRQAA